MFATGVTMGLAEWIIDDTCLVELFFARSCFYCIVLYYLSTMICYVLTRQARPSLFTHNVRTYVHKTQPH